MDMAQVLKSNYNISDFNELYTFYYTGFNVRATDLQAFLGLNQLKKLHKKLLIQLWMNIKEN